MKKIKLATIGLTLAALAGGAASAQTPMKMSMADKKMMGSCMAMSHDAMMKDSGCMAGMQKMKMSDDDMKTMMACRGMTKSAMMKDTTCMSMDKMHPGMMTMKMAK